MTRQPVDHILCAARFPARRNVGPVDHQNRQTEFSRRADFRIGCGTACVFRDNNLNPMSLQKGKIAFMGKRPTPNDDVMIGQWRKHAWWVDQAQQIEMLRVGRKFLQMHTSDGQHNLAPRTIQGLHRGSNIRQMGPSVIGLRPPRRAGQRNQRHIRSLAGLNRVAAHLRGKGVCRIDDMRDIIIAQIRNKAFNAAKPANPLVDWMRFGPGHTPGERQGAGKAARMHSLGQRSRLGRTCEDKKVRPHV